MTDDLTCTKHEFALNVIGIDAAVIVVLLAIIFVLAVMRP